MKMCNTVSKNIILFIYLFISYLKSELHQTNRDLLLARSGYFSSEKISLPKEKTKTYHQLTIFKRENVEQICEVEVISVADFEYLIRFLLS